MVTPGPFRWDLVTPHQLGTLLEGVSEPTLGFAPELARCSGKVLARSGNGDLLFVGRSLDSMFDLMSGALSEVENAPVLYRVPLSFARDWVGRSRRSLTAQELQVARGVLEAAGCTPNALGRRALPMTFVDVAHTGSIFGDLYGLIHDWVVEDRAPWKMVRTKIRFVGVTSRTKTSPNTVRWAQHQSWTQELPRKSVVSVSLDPHVWKLPRGSPTKADPFVRTRSLVGRGRWSRSQRAHSHRLSRSRRARLLWSEPQRSRAGGSRDGGGARFGRGMAPRDAFRSTQELSRDSNTGRAGRGMVGRSRQRHERSLRGRRLVANLDRVARRRRHPCLLAHTAEESVGDVPRFGATLVSGEKHGVLPPVLTTLDMRVRQKVHAVSVGTSTAPDHGHGRAEPTAA